MIRLASRQSLLQLERGPYPNRPSRVTCSFSPTRALSLKPPQSPRTRDRGRQVKPTPFGLHTPQSARDVIWDRNTTRDPTGHGGTERWPSSLFGSAYKAGVLEIEPDKVCAVLDDFVALRRLPSKETVDGLCSRYQIQPRILLILARILLRSGKPEHVRYAAPLLLSASRARVVAATHHIMKQALKSADLGSITAKEARRHLQESANINDPVSMLLEAKVLELEDRSLEATHFYERVANLTPSEGSALLQNERLDSRTLAQAESLSKADAWVQLARIQAKTGNQEASKANLVRAAFDYDSPIAFYLLAKYNSALSSPDYLPCMLKAASAGVPGAAHELGLYHLYQYFGWITPAPERQKAKWKIWWDTTTKFADLSAEKPGFFRTAAEWFAVAAEADYKASQVYLALLYHENSLQGSFVMPSISIIKRAPSTRVSDLKASQFLLDNLKTDGVWSSIAHRVRSKCVDNGEKNLEGSIRFAEGLMKRSTGTKIENGHEGFLHSINDLGP